VLLLLLQLLQLLSSIVSRDTAAAAACINATRMSGITCQR
jgi:hypothetical protein